MKYISIVSFLCIFVIIRVNCSLQNYKEIRKCNLHEFQCKNGQCIDEETLCDGRADCEDESDETNEVCSLISCPRFTYTCKYGACIHRKYRCNGVKNCIDNSDEENCKNNQALNAITTRNASVHHNHKKGKFICRSGEMINEELICDGESNCLDHSDETLNLCSNFYCPYFTFRCNYGACISLHKKCDGVNDCSDGSDEKSCILKPDVPATTTPVNVKKSFRCNSGKIIDEEYLCDGEPDCDDQSDETIKECAQFHCPSFSYRCKYGACVLSGARCNGIQECADNSDETSCSVSLQTFTIIVEKFNCNSGQTIEADMVCDGKADCKDLSDESEATCSDINCPRFTYRCNYGACVHGTARCNGFKECFDNSDEELCSTNKTFTQNYEEQLIFS